MIVVVLTYVVVAVTSFWLPVFRKPFIKGAEGIRGLFTTLAFKGFCMAGFLLLYPIFLIQEAYKWILKRKRSKHTDNSQAGLSHKDLIGAEGHLFCNQCGFIHLITVGKFDWKKNCYTSAYQKANTLDIVYHSVRFTNKVAIYKEEETNQELVCPSCFSSDIKYTCHCLQ